MTSSPVSIEPMKKDCKNCQHFYRVMAEESGYNPFPCCHLPEDTGESPKPLTKECFKQRKEIRRKPMTLTQNQYDVVEKIARKSGMDCWFSIKQDAAGNDSVYDLENKRTLPLRAGIEELAEGVTSYDGISETEIKIFEELLEQLHIEKPEV